MGEKKIESFTLDVDAEVEIEVFHDYVSGNVYFEIDLTDYYEPHEWDMLSEGEKRGFVDELIWQEIKNNAFYSVIDMEESIEYEEDKEK